MNESDVTVLSAAQEYLRNEVRPHAAAIDLDPEALRRALSGLCERRLMALKRPAEYGGPAISEEGFRYFQEEVARASGSLAFLQTQHQSAVGLIARGSNHDLKLSALPAMGDGRRLVGIGFSQLRRSGPPILTAERIEGGYHLVGHVPWVTGAGFYPEFLVGGQLEDGRAVFGIVPLVEQHGVRLGAPMRLAAMESAQTVTVDLDWCLPDALVADVKPPQWIHTNDQINIAIQGFFAIGCGRAGLDVVEEAWQRRGNEAVRDALAALDAELGECRAAMVEAQRLHGEDTTTGKLEIRAWAIDLAVRCAHAAIAASGGAANAIDHPAQRIYREALVYTVSAQTVPIMEATLARLSARR
ncbi:MAG TPA: acyl-CoA dehydrogenase family protein [Fimbriimonadaceae bacterium]|nr:acyl-CoA dehydrogenase family protein [Fimbriimonadaceae bacterium]